MTENGLRRAGLASLGDPNALEHNEDAGAVKLDGAFCLLLERVSLEPSYEVLGGTSEQDPLVVTRKDA